MFKKGDKVIALQSIEDLISKDATGICNRDPYDNGHVEVKWDGFDQGWGAGKAFWNVEIKAIKLYQESIKTLNKDTVKVGQKVRVIANTDGNTAGLKGGYEGIVTGWESDESTLFPGHKWVLIDNKSKGNAVISEYLELLEEPKSEPQNTNTMENPLITEAKRRYPVGSKAQCLVTKSFYPITKDVVFNEQEGKIFSYTNYGRSIYHKHYDGNTWAEVESKQSSEEFKVGDWVTITRSTGNWSSDMDKYVGKTVQITEFKYSHLGYSNVIRFKDDGGWTWETTNNHYRKATFLEIHEVQKLERYELSCKLVGELEVHIPEKYPLPFKECYTELPIVTSVKRSNIVPLKLEKQKSLINLPIKN